MSRAFFRKPEFRLLFGYPSLMLFRGPAGPIATASIAVPDPGAALAALAAEVARARGRLTAVLPEREVWRDLLDLPGRSPLARLRLARAAAASGLSARPDAVALVLGPPDAAGRTPAAAVRRDVLAETRGFLARVGLRPATITGAGDFPGFATPPQLWSRAWRSPPAFLAVIRPAPAAALGAGALLALALALALRPGAPEPAAPALPPPSTTAVEPAPAFAAGPAQPVAPALRPAPRPASFVPPVTAEAARAAPAALPVPVRVREPAPAPAVTLATRNIAVLPALPKPKGAPALRLAELTTARARLADAQPAPPFRRPAPAAQAAPADPPIAALPAIPAPMHRPPVAVPTPRAPSAAVAPAAEPPRLVTAPGTTLAPRPRPGPPAAATRAAPTVRVASLAPGPDVAALVAAALVATPPEPRVVAPVARPEPAARAPQPVQAKPVVQRQVSPQPVRAQPVRAKPAVQRQASPQPVRAQPAQPVAPRRASPQPVRAQAAAAPQPAQKRKAAAARPARSGIVLVGIFGSAGDRHALVQLSNGSMKRVRAGDSVQGVQVAAVGADAVRLHGGGRDALLRMPE